MPNSMVHHEQDTPQLILILGGARSGKSTFAERLALRSGRSVAFIATATASDDEMRERILHHRASRPASWSTIEEPYHLPDAVNRAAKQADVLLLDCMTIWLNNWFLAQKITDLEESTAATTPYTEAVLAAVDELLAAFAALPTNKTLVVVTNEVGLGIVPAYALGRIYRDLLGLVNQRLATVADRVYLMVAGLGVDIKHLHDEASL
jgi:adenosylcobinamide kinase / adenosylcobinamide-phosphate guanylyltransferase